MKWIRSPAWDLLWIWSGIPVGLLLATVAWWFSAPEYGFRGSLVETPMVWFFTAVVALETGHVISPIVLVWSHQELRQLAWRRRNRFIWLALGAFAVSFTIGAATSLGWTTFQPGLHQIYHVTNWSNPLPLLIYTYLIWNAYHFGMQNFGVTQLYKRLNKVSGYRWLTLGFTAGTTVLMIGALALFNVSQVLGFLALGIISLNHWLVEIGLSGQVSGRPLLFTVVILGLGCIGFAWLMPTSQGNFMIVVPAIIGTRLGVSFVHFLYDRWIWRLSDPQIRAIIAPRLLSV